MGDATQGAPMNRSFYVGSARKDNTEEVARRRAAMQQEMEQRQKLARRLQDEKMARAAAQKEERLLKQREAQQREMLRAKAVLDRRAHVLAEEKEKKEAVLAKAHAVASRLSAQHKSRPVYAFGSSTPRELGYLTQLTKEQKVYDRKLTPSDRSPAATSGSSGRLTSTPPNGSRNHTPGVSMTRSLYFARSEIKTRHKPVAHYMTQSVMVTPKTVKVAALNRTPVHRVSGSTTVASSGSELLKTTKKITHCPPLSGRKSRTTQPKPSGANEVPRPKPVPRRSIRPVEIEKIGDVKQLEADAVVISSLQSDNLNGTFVILGKENTQAWDIEVKNEAVSSVTANVDESVEEKLDEASGEKVEPENITVVPTVLQNEVNECSVAAEEKTSNVHFASNVEKTSTTDYASLLDLVSEGNTSMIDPTGSGVTEVIEAEFIFGKETNKTVEESNELQGLGVSEDENKEKEEVENQEESKIDFNARIEKPVAVDSDENLRKLEGGAAKVALQTLVVVQESETVSREEVITSEDKNKNTFPVAETNGNVIRAAAGVDDPLPVKTSSESVAEVERLAEEKRLVEERRRAQEERLEKEQRERELRKAKLASIMSRTRGSAPPMAVVTPTTQNFRNPEVVSQEPLKVTERVPSPVDSAPVKNVLSQTAASVLQKLATTNPKLLSVLQRNGSNPSLADELSAADPSMSVSLSGQPDEPIGAHEGSPTVRHLPFEPDVNHRPVAMK